MKLQLMLNKNLIEIDSKMKFAQAEDYREDQRASEQASSV